MAQKLVICSACLMKSVFVVVIVVVLHFIKVSYVTKTCSCNVRVVRSFNKMSLMCLDLFSVIDRFH